MNPKGTVGIEETQSKKYRLRLPRSVAAGSSRYLSTGLEVTPANLRAVKRLAIQIESDIDQGTFDTSLDRYRKPKTAPVNLEKSLTITELCDGFCNYRRSGLAETTYYREYRKKLLNRFRKLPIQDPKKAGQIRNYLVTNYSQDTSKRSLEYLSACCEWAVSSDLLTNNYFEGMAKGLKKSRKSIEEIDPFTVKERESIIEAFRTHLHHYHYAPMVAFMFYTGARPGEIAALTWGDISDRDVRIWRSYDTSLKLVKETKTGVTRRFPINEQLGSLISSMRTGEEARTDLVFTGPQGGRVNFTRFTNQVWRGCRSGKKVYRGVLGPLVETGAISRYRPPYNCRHTFITTMLEAGQSVTRVARLVGNSPEVILRHYSGVISGGDLPEI